MKNAKNILLFLKSEVAYKYQKYNHTRYQIRKDCARQCHVCTHTESATSGTLFHKIEFGVRKSFFICFEMSTTTQIL